jgi:hypothetical protein
MQVFREFVFERPSRVDFPRLLLGDAHVAPACDRRRKLGGPNAPDPLTDLGLNITIKPRDGRDGGSQRAVQRIASFNRHRLRRVPPRHRTALRVLHKFHLTPRRRLRNPKGSTDERASKEPARAEFRDNREGGVTATEEFMKRQFKPALENAARSMRYVLNTAPRLGGGVLTAADILTAKDKKRAVVGAVAGWAGGAAGAAAGGATGPLALVAAPAGPRPGRPAPRNWPSMSMTTRRRSGRCCGEGRVRRRRG